MNLKFYLRGLGIGMTVTALLLHFAPRETPEMSEKEIIEKARELGMTEKVTLGDVVVEMDNKTPTPAPVITVVAKTTATPTEKPAATPTDKSEDTPTPEDKATPTDKTTATPRRPPRSTPTPEATATPTPKATATPTPKPTEKPTATPTPKPTATSTPTPKPTATATPTPKPTATPTPKPTATPTPKPTATPTPEPTATPTPKPTATPTVAPTEAPADDGSPKSLNNDTIEISVTPGDSSYTVAKRLADAGAVPSAAEFDEFLCKNGYDRKISTGMHKIPAHTSYKRIGEILSGKK